MNAPIWNASDEADLRTLLRGVEEGDLAESLLAIEGAPLSVRLSVRGELDAWSQEVASLHPGDDPASALAALSAVLVDKLDLKGDSADYAHPRNSALSRVVDRRRGLPILLSSVWHIVGAGAGLKVEGVGRFRVFEMTPLQLKKRLAAQEGRAAGGTLDGFLGGVDLGQAPTAEQLAQLVRIVRSRRLAADDPEIVALVGVWDDVAAISDPPQAWIAVLTAVLADPDHLLY